MLPGGLLLLLLVELVQLLEEDGLGLHDGGLVAPALGAEPLALGLVVQLHAVEVEPLYGAEVVVAADHVAVRNLKRETNVVSRIIK